MLAGFDPASVRFRLVIDMTQALLVEIYREYDMKFQTAIAELHSVLEVPGSTAQTKRTEADEAASMAMLQSMMAGSDFKGPKG